MTTGAPNTAVTELMRRLRADDTRDRPALVISKTVKGKGVSFMENQVGWHGKAPNAEQREQALKELED